MGMAPLGVVEVVAGCLDAADTVATFACGACLQVVRHKCRALRSSK